MRIRRYFSVFVAIIFLTLAIFGLGVLPVNLFFIKTTISETAREQWGVELNIEGPLRLRLGFNPALSASDITVISPDHGLADPLEVDSLLVKPGLLRLLKGQIDIRKARAEGIRFGSGKATAAGLLPEAMQLEAAAPLNGPLEFSISGQQEREPLKLSVEGASLNALLSAPAEYPLTLEFEGFSTELLIDGLIREPLKQPQLDAEAELKIQDLSRALSVFNLPPTETVSLSIQSKLSVDSEQLRIDALDGVLGETAFQLSALARPFLPRPWFELAITLPELDIAATSGAYSKETTAQSPIDFQPLFDILSGFDGQASLAIGRLVNVPLPVEQVQVNATLDQRRLQIDHAGLTVEQANLSAQATLDMSADCEQLDSTFELSALDLEILNVFIDENSGWGGSTGSARMTTGSCGSSLDEHLRSLHILAVVDDIRPRRADEALPLSLSRLEANVNWNEPGRVFLDGELIGKMLTVTADFGPVETLLQNEPYPIAITADGDRFSASLQGTGIFMNDQAELDVTLSADVSDMGSLHAWLGTSPENQLAFSGQSRLRLNHNGVFIDQLDAVLGRSDIRGNLGLPGPESDLPIAVELVSTHLDLEEISGLFPEEDPPGEAASEEWSDLFDGNEWIDRWFSLPSVDIDFSASRIGGLEIDVNGVHLHARLRDRLVEDGQLDFQLDDLLIAATLDIDLRDTPYTIDGTSVLSQFDAGRLMRALGLADAIDAQADSAVVHYESDGRSLHELAANSRLKAKIENLHWGLEAGPEKRRFDFDLSELELLVRPSSRTTWRTSGTLNEFPVKAWMQTPSLPDTFQPDASLPLTLVIGAGDQVLMLDVVIESLTRNDLQAVLELSGAVMDPAAIDFSTLQSPLRDYRVKTRVEAKDMSYRISDFTARVGSSELSGNLSITGDKDFYRFDAEVNSPFLETDDFVKWAEAIRVAKSAREQERVSADGAEAVDEGLLALAERYFNEFAGDNHYHLSADFGEVRSSGNLLGQGELELSIDDEKVLLDPVKFILPGGNLDIYYRGQETAAGHEYVFDIDVAELKYGGLLQLLDPDTKARGTAFLDVDLVSRTPAPDQLLNNLTGTVDMAMFPEGAAAGFLDLWASNLVLALLPAAGDSDKQLNCLVARYEVNDGVMTSKNTFLDSTEIIVWARGEIDLGRRQLDLLFAPQAKVEKFLSISAPIEVTGPFDDFQVGVAPGGFLATMFRWYMNLIYVPWKWLTGDRFPPDGVTTCFNAMDWELPETTKKP